MYYYMTTYNFDSDRPVAGPYKTEDECWEAMKLDAEKEFRIDTEENGWDTDPLELNRDAGIIVLNNNFSDHVDTTTWTIVDAPSEINEKKLGKILKVFEDSDLDAEKAKDMYQKIEEILFA